MLILMWPNHRNDDYSPIDLLGFNKPSLNFMKGMKCCKQMISSPLDFTQLNYEAKPEHSDMKKCVQSVSNKIPMLVLHKLNINQDDTVLIKNGRILLECKDFNKLHSLALTSLNHIGDKYFILLHGRIFKEYDSKSGAGYSLASKACGLYNDINSRTKHSMTNKYSSNIKSTGPKRISSSSKNHEIEAIAKNNCRVIVENIDSKVHSLENFGLSSSYKTHEMKGRPSAKECNKSMIAQNNCRVIVQKLNGKIHSMANFRSSSSSKNNEIEGNAKECNKNMIAQNNCTVKVEKIDSKIHYMAYFGLKPKFTINLGKTDVLYDKMKRAKKCKVVLKRLGVVEHIKFKYASKILAMKHSLKKKKKL